VRGWPGDIAIVSNDYTTSVLWRHCKFWQGIYIPRHITTVSNDLTVYTLQGYCNSWLLTGCCSKQPSQDLAQTMDDHHAREMWNLFPTQYHNCDTYISSSTLEFSCNLLSPNGNMLRLMYDSVFRYNLHIFDMVLPQISIQNISCLIPWYMHNL